MKQDQSPSERKNFARHDCGSIQIASKADYGWLCLPCLGKRDDRISEMISRPGVIFGQKIDADAPPEPCGCRNCTRDAVVMYRMYDGRFKCGFTACAEHTEAAFTAAWRAKSLADA